MPSTTQPSGTPIHVPALGQHLPVLMDVPPSGEIAGMSRWASYRAAEDGIMPTIRVGHRLRVPTARWLDVLGLSYTKQIFASEEASQPPASGVESEGPTRP